MNNNKRSFFERLSGAVKLEEEAEEIRMRQASVHSPVANIFEEEKEEEGQLTVDVYQTPSDIIIKTMVAGVKPDDLDVSITRDTVTIRGRREEEQTIANVDYFHRELYWGSFSRTIVLPEEIDVEEAEAIEKFGLLILVLPKVDKNRSTKLKVRGQ
ncbi:MAG: Hsp20/alpha crystallin family protein [bacterium]|nr:Hsp20/alpha crystallin family protein [bacterium]